MEEFIQADEEYNHKRLSIIEKIEKGTSLSDAEIREMIASLESAGNHSMNSAIELTKISLMEAKEAASAAGRIEYELSRLRTRSPRKSRVEQLQNELDISEKMTDMIKAVVEQYNSEKKRLNELESERLRIESELTEVQKKQNEIDEVKTEMTQVIAEIEAKTLRLDQIEKEIDELEKIYQSTVSEREHNSRLKEEIDVQIRNNKITISKLEDEAFIRNAEIEKRIESLNSILKLRNTLDEERLELKNNFTVDNPVEDYEKQEVADEIEGLKSEKDRLQNEIERIEELIFRKRVKY
jgi:DNA repair exonuclease SbcCD ATPase subunit